MRIAHFCDSHPGRPDGVSRSAELTVELLRSAGHEVDFYYPGRVPSLPVPGRQLRIGSPWFRCGPADIFHAHTTGPIGMAAFRLAARRGVPLVVTWHTDLVAYADTYPEIPIGAAWCALQLRLGWSPQEFLQLTRPGATRRARLIALGRGMANHMAAAIVPSAKTAESFALFNPTPEVHVLPTPVAPTTPHPPIQPTAPPTPPTPTPSATTRRNTAPPRLATTSRHPALPTSATTSRRPALPTPATTSRQPTPPTPSAETRRTSPDTAAPAEAHPTSPDTAAPAEAHPTSPDTAAPAQTRPTSPDTAAPAQTRPTRPNLAPPTAAARAAPRAPGRNVVLSVGRVTAEKNPGLLLDAFALLRDEKPDARLILLGVRQGHAALMRRLRDLDLERHVDVLPPVPRADVDTFYRAADVLAFASTTDTQSLVLAEAEAVGLPAVVADPALAARPGDAGPPRFTCRPQPHEFAAALCRLLDDEPLRAEVIRAGLAATAAYPPELYLNRLEKLYQQL
ncbi:glycosyltransferase [Actinoplanes sp. Pm04-4]|uniref:Glycosyltransferase n=1 Tax=Paractinoplanes pyxinae TaxID=2997416 RepID=A0ABT4B3J1_9ACTN|nr:glycosyltransferase [Actinoplanes pyxinae]MCY1141064.1 glycosyltransferase [Actinoplanes pyxinae]